MEGFVPPQALQYQYGQLPRPAGTNALYVVPQGHEPRIYATWGQAERQMLGWPHPVIYYTCVTLQDALNVWNSVCPGSRLVRRQPPGPQLLPVYPHNGPAYFPLEISPLVPDGHQPSTGAAGAITNVAGLEGLPGLGNTEDRLDNYLLEVAIPLLVYRIRENLSVPPP